MTTSNGGNQYGPFKYYSLTDRDHEYLAKVCSDGQMLKSEKISLLKRKFNISRRTLFRWIKKLDLLDEMAKSRIEGCTTSPAKVLLFDIETSPLQAYIWSVWNQNIGYSLEQLQADWFMISWSAKWLFEDEIYGEVLTPKEIKEESDKRIVKGLWDLLNECDICIAHNCDRFDLKRLNTRLLKHEIPPPLPFRTIDTLKVCKRQFNITSNRLDFIAKFLGLEGKMDTGGFELWKKCMQGNPEALNKMLDYNTKDILVLEEVYLKLRPYIRSHPNVSLYLEEDVESCPSCSSVDLKWGGEYATSSNLYASFRCNNCGSVGRSKKSKTKNKELVLPVAR